MDPRPVWRRSLREPRRSSGPHRALDGPPRAGHADLPAAPAAAAALGRIQDTVGVTLLPELVDLYQWHDGSSGPARPFWIAPDFGFLPLQGMLDDWQMSNDVFGIDPHTGSALWHPAGFP